MAAMKTAYHIGNGPTQMYAVDAESAVLRHPAEWSLDPWSIEETNAFNRRQHEKAASEAADRGEPPPPEPEELVLSDAQKAELSADDQARAEAHEIVAEDDRRQAAEREWQAKVAAARSLLATPRHQPQPEPQPAPPEQAVDPDTVNIPEDWKTSHGSKRRGLAVRLGAPNNVKVDEADGYIEAELKRRADKEK